MRIAFDLDGTLVASLSHIHHALSLALRDLDLPELEEHVVRGFVGNGLPTLIRRCTKHLDLPAHADALHRRTLHHYVTLPSDPASVYPGVGEALDTLRTDGHSLAICTNKPFQAALSALRDTQLLNRFDLVIGGDSLSTRKPDPAMLLACAPDLYVGDSEVDAETASAAGIPFLLFTEGYRKSPVADLVCAAHFDRFSILPSLVRKYPRG